jgi:soluble lytic murein transglycosylase
MREGIAFGLALLFLAAEAWAGASTAMSPEASLSAAVHEVEAGDLKGATDILKGLEAGSPPASVQPRADLLLGLLLMRQNQPEEAIAYLERAALSFPLLGDYALYFLAQAEQDAGRNGIAAAVLSRLVEQHPESLYLERVRRELPRDWLQADEFTQAEEAALQYLSLFPQGPGRALVWVTLGEALLRLDRAERAEEILRRVWIEFPGGPESQRAKDLLATIPGLRPFTPEEQFRRALTLYHLGRYGPALQELKAFAVPASPYETKARLYLGLSAFNLRQFSQAIQWLQPLRDVAGPERAEAIFWLGRSLGRSGDYPGFVEQMTFLLDVAPKSRWAEEGLYLLGRATADQADAAQAQTYLARFLQEYPKSTWADDALWLQGWLAYKGGEPKAALAAWDRLLAEDPGSSFRVSALYWRGRVLEALHHPREAVQAYRTLLAAAVDAPYYRFHAEERLKQLKHPERRIEGPAPAPAGRGGKGERIHAEKAQALRALGLRDEAVAEYGEQVRAHPEDRGELAEACRIFLELRRYDRAVWLGNRILRPLYVQENGRPPIRDFWQCVYPLAQWPLVSQEAKVQGVDPYLVTALMREESAFAPQAVSWAGARGLMQLMPETADQVAKKYSVARDPSTPLETPEVNIRLGTIHLAELLRDNGGSLSLALASYNAGRQQVRNWIQRFGFTDAEQFTEDIPYTETRNYVKRVLGTYERYTSLYGGERAASRRPGPAKHTGKSAKRQTRPVSHKKR